MPVKVVESVECLPEFKGFDSASDLFRCRVEFLEDFFIMRERRIFGGYYFPLTGAESYKRKSPRIPQFIQNLFSWTRRVIRPAYVLRAHCLPDKAEARGINPVFLDELHGVDDVAFRLRHLFSVFIENCWMSVDCFKRNIFHKFKPGKKHTENPEIKNLACGRNSCGWVKCLEVGCFIGPPKRDKWPEG